MSSLKISENIIELRHKRGITQEGLASFLGVTKASVSKWETRQSYPDILLLPQIAAFFDVSIDFLMGYEPQLSPEQIKVIYHELAEEFTNQPFEEVMKKSKGLVKKYYSCYPFLMQMAILWLNHFMLAEDKTRQQEILMEIEEICTWICEGSSEVGLHTDGLVLKALVNLQMGRPEEVIETLEPMREPNRLLIQSDHILIQAYQMKGEMEKADYYSQISIYTQLLSLVGDSTVLIGLHMDNRELCETTIDRISKIIQIYDLENLHPNTSLQFHYQTAIFYCHNRQRQKALGKLKLFVTQCVKFLEHGITLHGDSYFNRLDEWFEEFALGTEAPRSKTLIWDSLMQGLLNPQLSFLFEEEEYKRMVNELKRRLKSEKETRS